VIEGALPGMYNLDRDPDNLKGYVRQQYEQRMQDIRQAPVSGPMNPMNRPMLGDEMQAELEAEARRRGYTGVYRPDPGTHYGSSSSVTTPVDLTGAAPNIAGMRKNLGLDVAPGGPETVLQPDAPYAQVNTESMPGAQYFADRYKGYADSPAAGAMLHADYEQLLRDPDGGSVIARELGIQDAPVRQATGVYEGQRNPLSAARVRVTPPEIGPDMDPDLIARTGLSKADRARLDAMALTEGMLRDQDAVAWTYPLKMTDEAAMPTEGIPWDAVNSAMFRSSAIGNRELGEVADTMRKMPLPEGMFPDEPDLTWEELVAVSPPPDGSGGVMLTNVGDLPPQTFQAFVRQLRDQFPNWRKYRNLRTQWGRAETGFYMRDEFADAIKKLPEDLRRKVEETYSKYEPYTQQIKSYHDGLRNVEKKDYPIDMPMQSDDPNNLYPLLGLGALGVGTSALRDDR
jgi:hypothetical protein